MMGVEWFYGETANILSMQPRRRGRLDSLSASAESSLGQERRGGVKGRSISCHVH